MLKIKQYLLLFLLLNLFKADSVPTATGANTITTDTTQTTGTFSSTTADQNVFLVSSGATLTLSGDITINKSGDASDTENAEFYGINAAILVQNSSSAIISGVTINSSGKGANSVFAYGSGSNIVISNSKINSTGASSARGLLSTYTGTITGTELEITTTGGSCAALATDRGEGVVTCSKCTLSTAGAGSPVIYSTGVITISDQTTGTATGAQMVVVEGKNSAIVKDSTLTGNGVGNRNGIDSCGIFIYQSQSGDADSGIASFTATNSSFTVSSTNISYPMFFVTNTQATITINSGNTFTFPSGKFLDVSATNASVGWGTSGSNGGDLTITLNGQNITGDITVDEISSMNLYLTNGSYFKGTINGDKTGCVVTVSIDSTSTWELTGNSYANVTNEGTLTIGSYTVSAIDSCETNNNNNSGNSGNGPNSTNTTTTTNSSVNDSSDSALFLKNIFYVVTLFIFVF